MLRNGTPARKVECFTCIVYVLDNVQMKCSLSKTYNCAIFDYDADSRVHCQYI